MAKVNLQFHATPEELLAWATDWALEHELHMVVERFFPETRFVAVEGTDVRSAVERLDGTWNRLWFSLDKLGFDASLDPPFVGDPE
jgi:hypothetical protein